VRLNSRERLRNLKVKSEYDIHVSRLNRGKFEELLTTKLTILWPFQYIELSQQKLIHFNIQLFDTIPSWCTLGSRRTLILL